MLYKGYTLMTPSLCQETNHHHPQFPLISQRHSKQHRHHHLHRRRRRLPRHTHLIICRTREAFTIQMAL